MPQPSRCMTADQIRAYAETCAKLDAWGTAWSKAVHDGIAVGMSVEDIAGLTGYPVQDVLAGLGRPTFVDDEVAVLGGKDEEG